ncbi:hypothetical protein [uncultured Clostridium sp.]|uniref:hypothetical protein n=1 Tax=uncultured Clostridium sp. TaxID=59620 RepID=UPI0028E5602C|nr:hypothetical protein [uncultured Clostridium sp.]
MKRYMFSIISIINLFFIFKIGTNFFIDYFVMNENIPDGIDNIATVGLAGAAVGMLFFIANIIFLICIFTRASKKGIKKIYLNEFFINRKDNLLRNIVRGVTYLMIIYFIILSFREKHNIISFQFYSLSIISIVIYSIWINNILRKNA